MRATQWWFALLCLLCLADCTSSHMSGLQNETLEFQAYRWKEERGEVWACLNNAGISILGRAVDQDLPEEV